MNSKKNEFYFDKLFNNKTLGELFKKLNPFILKMLPILLIPISIGLIELSISRENFIEFWFSSIVPWKLQNSSDFLTIIFGITGGVIGLVGLIAIFVSMNSQHNLQKCRELNWDLVSMKYKKDYSAFFEIYSLYSSIYYDSPKEQFTIRIIKTARYAIWFVIITWTIITIFTISKFYLFEYILILATLYIAVYILLRFNNYLDKLSNIMEESQLPNPRDILDVTKIKDTKINTFESLFNLMELYPEWDVNLDDLYYDNDSFEYDEDTVRNKLSLSIGFPFEIYNLSISVLIIGSMESENAKEFDSTSNVKLANKYRKYSGLEWYKIYEVEEDMMDDLRNFRKHSKELLVQLIFELDDFGLDDEINSYYDVSFKIPNPIVENKKGQIINGKRYKPSDIIYGRVE